MVLRGIAFKYFGVCDRSFRHAGIPDVIAIGKAVGTSTLLLYLTSLVIEFRGGAALPGHMLIGDALLVFLLLCALHFGARIYHFGAERPVKTVSSVRRVVIFGAGDAGASVLKELIDSPRSGILPVAILDDDPKKKGTLICGVPVIGGLSKLSDTLFAFQASEVLICVPSATQEQRQRVLGQCLKCGFRSAPSRVSRTCLNNRASTPRFARGFDRGSAAERTICS